MKLSLLDRLLWKHKKLFWISAVSITIGLVGLCIWDMNRTKLVEVDGDIYLMENGEVVTGLAEYDGATYYFDSEGKVMSGWVESNTGEWRFFDPETNEGVSGNTSILDQEYNFSDDGVLKSGWQVDGTVYTKTGEQIKDGYVEINSQTYLLDETGSCITGWVTDKDEVRKYFKNDGSLAVGEVEIDGDKYFFQDDGVLLTGWQEVEVPVESDEKNEDKDIEEDQVDEDSADAENTEKQEDKESEEVDLEEPKTDADDSGTEVEDTDVETETSNEILSITETIPEVTAPVESEEKEEITEENTEATESNTDEEAADSEDQKDDEEKVDDKEQDAEAKVETKTVKTYYTKYGYQVKNKIWTIGGKDYAFDENGYLLTESNTKFYVNEDGTARLMSDYEAEQAELAEKERIEEEKRQAELQKQLEASKKELSSQVSDSNNAADMSADSRSAIAAAALSQIGVNQDCTSLASNALAAAGISFHGWPSDYASLGHWVSGEDLQAGDLVIYNQHIAVYVGNGKAVHGGWNGYTTVESSVACANALIGFIRVEG